MIRVTLMHVEDRETQVYETFMPAVPTVGHIIGVEVVGESTIHYVVRGVDWTVPGLRHPLPDFEKIPADKLDDLWSRAHKVRYGPLIWIDDAELDDKEGRFFLARPID